MTRREFMHFRSTIDTSRSRTRRVQFIIFSFIKKGFFCFTQLGVCPKFLIFKLVNVSNKDAISTRKRLLRSAINKGNKELEHISKEFSLSENFLSTQLSITDFYILTKSLTSYNKKSRQKSLYTQQKKLSLLTRDCNLPKFTANKTITNLTKYELS